MSTRTSRGLKGMPLSARLALATGFVVAVSMIVFGLVLGRFLEDTVEEQIMRTAAEAARAAAQAEVEAWGPFFRTEDQGLTPNEAQRRHDEMSDAARRLFDRDQGRAAQVEYNRTRLSRFLEDDSTFLAVELFRVLEGRRANLVASSYEGRAEFVEVRGARRAAYGDGESVEGLLTVAGSEAGRQHVFRGSHPVYDRDGVQRGEMVVYIHARAVDEAAGDFRAKVAYGTLIITFVGAALSFLLGRRVSRPLRLLQEDMHIVARGEFDHRTRAHSSDEVGDLARTFDQMTRSLEEAREAERQVARSQRQVEVAAEVTQSLYPDVLPEIPGYSTAGLHDLSGQLGSEYYDVVPMPGGRWGLLVAGVSGSGVPAAIVMGMARSFLRATAEHESDPGEVLRQVNRLLSGDLRRGMFVTMLLCVLDPRQHKVFVANAGHSPLLTYRAVEGKLGQVHSEGIALGFDKGPVFDQTLKVAEVEMEPGDRVVLYTPGITQLVGAKGEHLGDRRFLGLMKREAALESQEFVDRISATLGAFRGDRELDDDVTLLTLGRDT